MEITPQIHTSHNCILSALWTFLSKKSIPYNDAEILIIGNGINLKYDLTKTEYTIPDMILGLEKVGIETKEISIKNMTKRVIIDLISKNNDVILFVKTCQLNYNDFYMKEAEDKTHFVIISKDNTEENTLIIIDPHYTKDYTYKLDSYIGCIEVDTILSAGISFYIINTNNISQINKYALIKMFLFELYDFVKGRIDDKYVYGMKTLSFFKKNIFAIKVDEDLSKHCEKIHYEINICSIVYLLKSFMLVLDKLLGNEKMSSLKFECQDLIKKWVDFSFLLLSYGIKGDIKHIYDMETKYRILALELENYIWKLIYAIEVNVNQ